MVCLDFAFDNIARKGTRLLHRILAQAILSTSLLNDGQSSGPRICLKERSQNRTESIARPRGKFPPRHSSIRRHTCPFFWRFNIFASAAVTQFPVCIEATGREVLAESGEDFSRSKIRNSIDFYVFFLAHTCGLGKTQGVEVH